MFCLKAPGRCKALHPACDHEFRKSPSDSGPVVDSDVTRVEEHPWVPAVRGAEPPASALRGAALASFPGEKQVQGGGRDVPSVRSSVPTPACPARQCGVLEPPPGGRGPLPQAPLPESPPHALGCAQHAVLGFQLDTSRSLCGGSSCLAWSQLKGTAVTASSAPCAE